MDNKKWYKRFGTLFWWFFTILPLLVALIQFIGYHLTFNSGIASYSDLSAYHELVNGEFIHILSNVLGRFDLFNISFFKTTFTQLFNIMGVSNASGLGVLLAYMVSVSIYHLTFDLFTWLPCFFHKLLDKANIGE